MEHFNKDVLKQLYVPPSNSHKGQNGKLMVIGGSHLFHAASLWALDIASKLVDMVFYSSVPENNEIVQKVKEEFRDGIVVRREHIEDYIDEADAILIGPGMMRTENFQPTEKELRSIEEVNSFSDEGMQTYYLTKYLITNYPHKKWVIDAGALQMMEPEWLKALGGNVILTPHPKELAGLELRIKNQELRDKLKDKTLEEKVDLLAREFNCIILLKGEKDIVCSPERCVEIAGGNAGMTKGGTGDVLAGLVAALACKNELFLAATAGSYINKKAGESLFEKVGYNFNASDLANEIPFVMKRLF